MEYLQSDASSIILENMVKPLTPKQASERIAQGSVEVIDVRDPHEWIDGHVPTARLVPLAELRQNPRAALPRDGVIFVCAAGVRSETAARLAAQQGLKEVYNLTGGTRAWIKAGLPLEHEPAVTAAE
jgi:rhodanese-related sulfurtransferase